MKRALSIILLSIVAAVAGFAQTPQQQPPKQDAGTKPAPAQKPAEALPTVDQILEKYVQAIGGKAAVQKNNSTASKGTIDIPVAGITAPIEMYEKAPNKSLVIVTIPGFGVAAEGFDGTVGWAQDPQTGLRDKTGSELSAVKRSSDFYRDIKLKELYTKMEVKGKEKVGEREAYVVEATPADGPVDKYFFDTQTGLILRMDNTLDSPVGQIPFETYLEDYREVDGVKLPFIIRRNSSVVSMTIKIDEVKHNVPVDDAKFTKPAK